MPRSVSDCAPREEERNSPEAPSPTSVTPTRPPHRTRANPCECNTCLCHRGRPTVARLKGCKRKRVAQSQTSVKEAKRDTENELFSHKRAELQRYLPPLSAILRGLKSGRYSERLSSFQESVAMDRIQRIMGVLMNPHPGAALLRTLLKIEEMLHTWFPHVRDTSLRKRQKSSCPFAPACFYYSSHNAPAPWPRRPAGPAPSATQDTSVSSSSDVDTAPPTDQAPPRPSVFTLHSPCLERLLRTKDSLIQTRTGPRPDPRLD